jgi:hypothetical protein
MSRGSDFPYEMFGSWLDQDAADRLLAGRTEPDDAPPGFDGVARLVSALSGSPLDREVEDERRAVAAAVRVMDEAAPAPTHARRWRMRSKLSRTKLAGLVIVGTMIGTTGMAAANVLPDPAQDVVSKALSHVGITVPSATGTVDTTTVGTTTIDTTTVTSATDPTTIDHPAATGEEISRIATTNGAIGVEKGAEISTTASGGMSQAGMHAGSDTATGGAATAVGAGTANDASGGHSDAGAGNAPVPPTP